MSLNHSAALDKVIAISKPYDYYSSGSLKVTDSEIQVYDYEYFSDAGRIPLPQFTAGSKTFAAHGKFVTYWADSSKIYVIAQADATSGLNNDFGSTWFNGTPRELRSVAGSEFEFNELESSRRDCAGHGA